MKHIVKNFKGHYKEIILGPFFKLFEAVLELLVPLVVADIIDVGIRTGNTKYIWQRALVLLVLAVAGVISAMVCQYFAAVAGGHFGLSLRKQLYHHVLTLSPAQIEQFGTGGLITRLTNDTNQMQNGLNMTIRLATRAPFLAIGSIVLALTLNFKIGLIFLLSTPLVVFVLYVIMKRTLPRYGDIQQEQDDLSRLSSENLEGMRVIRAFSRQKNEKAAFAAVADKLSALLVKVGKVSAALNPLTSVIVGGAIIAIVWLGSRYAFAGSILPGEIIALVSYMNQTLLALIVAANLIVLFTRAVASTKRVAAVLNTQPAIVDGPGAAPLAGAPAVQCKQVTFGYHGNQADPALEDISFTLPAGQTLGIIGGTGSGKSTLVNLLVRNFDVTSGSIDVFGQDIRQYTLGQLRSQFGFVPQTAALFEGSIRHNLAVGCPSAMDEEMWRALQIAQAAEFVQKMPEGLNTIIKEGGKNLSGGQKQRLTIARALVRNPEILVLDDSASALDLATDAALRSALHKQAANMTIIVVSQRAVSIKAANQILVLDDGKIVAGGSHQQLLQTSSIYREICHSQGLV